MSHSSQLLHRLPETGYLIGLLRKMHKARESTKFLIQCQKNDLFPKFTHIKKKVIEKTKLTPTQITTVLNRLMAF